MQETSNEIRTFIAIELPEGVKSFLKEHVALLRSFGGNVKWTRAESTHLTLKFLGNIPKDDVDTIASRLMPFFGRQERLPLSVKGAGGFPTLSKPRVIWIGLRDASGLLAPMVADLEGLLEPLGFEKEKRAFSPHLTLGRLRQGRVSPDLIDSLRQMQDLTGPAFTADHAVFFQSILKPSGAQYVPLVRFDFSSA
jgi:2'-5' RNA ligase